MESLESPIMHATDTKPICSTLPCGDNRGDEISKNLEDELLYGANEDGDEDDAQSDDSLRLRLSDDDVDDDIGASLPTDQLKQPEKTEPPAIDNATQKENSPSGINDTQQRIDEDTDIELITTDNDSPRLSEPESSTDKLNASPSPSEKISVPLNNGNVPKENGIMDESNGTIMTCEIDKSITSEDNNTADEPVHKSEVELFDVPITIKAEVHDISENTNVLSADGLDTSSKNSEHEEIKETASPASNIVATKSIDDLPNDETISNEKELAGETPNEKTTPNDEPITLQEDDSQLVPDNAAAVIKENDDISEIGGVPDCSKHDDNADSKKGNKLGKKRSLKVTDDDNSVCKKVPCPESFINERASNSKVKMKEVSSSGEPSTTEKCSDVETIAENKTATNKLDNDNEKSISINIKSESPEKILMLPIEILDDDDNLIKDDDKLEITAVIPPSEISTKGKRRRRKRKTNPMGDVVNSGQEKENVRQKRETAQKAEEMIRKRFLNSDSDSESSDNVPVFANHNKPNPRARPSSPPSLKRICPEEPVESTMVKKVKNELDTNISSKTNETVKPTNNIKTLEQVRKFFWRDGKKSLSKFTQEELEELLIQKVIETITMRDEIGKLREQAKISERNQEATRLKCQQLTKQIKDFEMVLNRFAADRRGGDKSVPPIKINRSVGLQVNFMTDSGIQNLRQLEHNMKSNATVVNGGNALPKQSNELPNNNPTTRKGIKVRSPRRPSEVPPLSPVSTVSVASTPVQSSVTSTVTPAALVVSKPTDNRHIINSGGQVITQQGTITLNGALTATVRQTRVLNSRSSNSNSDNLIDLTGEEENKSKNLINPPPLTAITTSSTSAIIPKAPPRYQRVIQPTPANVTISQSAFKIVQPVDNKPMPTAIVNNMNNSRFALVMQNIAGPRQLLMTTNSNTIRPTVTTHSRTLLSGITYSGVQTISNGSVRVVPATTNASAQKHKHPAPLPGVTTYPINAALKLPPPAPSLKISKVANGIVLSWNMRNSDEYAEIASYQLYAYQEVTGVAPSTALWKKVGDVRALPLPMACTLTQFSEGNNYYFAVRGVDTHSRLGQYSQPGNISL